MTRLIRAPLLVMLLAALASCAAAPPPPDAPRILVFFGLWSALIDPAASSTIASAAQRAAADPAATVWVRGFADPSGSQAANKLISGLRAQMVVDTLVADGVPAARIQQQALSSTDYIASPQESRRAAIIIARAAP